MQIFATERKLTPSWGLLKPSFELLKQNIWPVAYLSFLPTLLLSVGVAMIEPMLEGSSTDSAGIALPLIGFSMIWLLLASGGYIYMQLRAANGEHLEPLEAFRRGLPYVPKLFIAGLLSTILIFIGLLLFVIPGLLLIRGFILAPYYVVAKNLGPIAALKRSYADSRPVSGWIWGFIGVWMVFSFIAALLDYIPIVGVLLATIASYPYVFAGALRYREVADGRTVPVED